MIVAALVLAVTASARQASPDSGAIFYQAWCAKCHGTDGRGVAARQTRLSVRPASLADCRTSTAETEAGWTAIVRDGGAAFGLSLDMPAFGNGASIEDLRTVVRYIRSLCGQRGWPPGELNLPRPFLAEKAYPENEVVVTLHGREQEYIYERRLGRRAQLEASARTVFDSLARRLGGVTGALKYNVWYSSTARALASVGLEATPPVGRADAWEIEPFIALGANPWAGLVLQGELGTAWEDGGGITGASYSLGLGLEAARFVPMLEVGGTIPRAGESTVSVVPQLRMQLSRLGHVAGSLGVDVPTSGPQPRHPRLTAFVSWDYGDAGLLRGW